MPKGPRGEKRPADAIERAVLIAKIATGEVEDVTDAEVKKARLRWVGRAGKLARKNSRRASAQKLLAMPRKLDGKRPLATSDELLEGRAT